MKNNEMRKLIILGSSRRNGHTKEVVRKLSTLSDFDILNLSDYSIGHYDYQHKNEADDFLRLIGKILNNYDTLVFATPVYWYSMSGTIKVFFDRITDLLDRHKDVGGKFRKKNMAVITSSAGDNLAEKFWLPFLEIARYIGMSYLGNIHTIENKDPIPDLVKFVEIFDGKNQLISPHNE